MPNPKGSYSFKMSLEATESKKYKLENRATKDNMDSDSSLL